MYERQWVKCKRKRNLKNIKSSFWLPIWFVWTNILVHPLANKSWWLKGIIFWNTIFLDCVCPNTPPYKVSHHPSVFLGQIWSQKLKFSKLTKIWYRGIHCYILISNLMFIIFKMFVIHIFWANLVPKTGVLSKSIEIWYRSRLPYAYFNFNVFFFKFLLFI